MNYKRFGMLSLCLSVLGGCIASSNSEYMYRSTPVTKSKKAKDLLDCELKAVKAVPTNKQVGTTPAYVTPTYTTPVTCTTTGLFTSCTGGQTFGGQVVGGEVFSYDANSGLRARVYNQCLTQKGYVKTSQPIPECRPNQIPKGYVRPNALVYAPVKGACVITASNGGGSLVLRPKDQLVPN